MHTPAPADSIQNLTSKICAFRDARNWSQFHSPKDMAVALCAEAGELLQHFVWLSQEQSTLRISERRPEIASEMADIAILLFEFAHNSQINLSEAVLEKLDRNALRYPVEKASGSNRKYNEL